MKGLRKYLTPFAPDQSGAVSILFPLNALIVIMDAGGCTGNICGFDEPRWFKTKAPIFSAGLRDIDAIMGRDDILIKKIVDAVNKCKPDFISLIGTPVPAVIASDLYALGKLVEEKTAIKTISIETGGMKLYGDGIKACYKEILSTFMGETKDYCGENISSILLLGYSPLDSMDIGYIRDYYSKEYENIDIFGDNIGIDCFKNIGKYKKIIALSVSSIKTAETISKKTGIPYEAICPYNSINLNKIYRNQVLDESLHIEDLKDKKVLIVHEYIKGISIKTELIKKGFKEENIERAGFFKMPDGIRLKEEDDFISLIKKKDYDLLIADEVLTPIFKKEIAKNIYFIKENHFALSGRK